jgi:hypothetical protein
LQRLDAFASEVSLSCSSQDRLGGKTVLDPKSIFHDPSQPFVLNFCHASKITNEFHNRKLKNPGPLPKGVSGTAAIWNSAFRRLCGSMIA